MNFISHSHAGKTEGFDNFVVEKIKIISSSENLANEGFISIKNTTDTNQKAWRKKQLVYKLGKTDNLSEYITDIVVLTKFKSLPEGFVYLGELEKVHVCFKITPAKSTEIIDFTQQIENLKIQSNNLYPMVSKRVFNAPLAPLTLTIFIRFFFSFFVSGSLSKKFFSNAVYYADK